MQPDEFYDSQAATYDQMIPFDKRLVAARAFVHRLQQHLAPSPIQSAIDTATGTGLYALALADLGIRVTGIDLSTNMIQQARQRSATLGLNVNWITGSMTETHLLLPASADLVLCMGNSLPHLPEAGLAICFQSFSQVLYSGGTLVLQLVNLPRLLATNTRKLATTEKDGITFERYYQYQTPNDPQITFCIRRTDPNGQQSISETTLLVLTPEKITNLLKPAGFTIITILDDTAFQTGSQTTFDSAASQTLLIIAQKC